MQQNQLMYHVSGYVNNTHIKNPVKRAVGPGLIYFDFSIKNMNFNENGRIVITKHRLISCNGFDNLGLMSQTVPESINETLRTFFL